MEIFKSSIIALLLFVTTFSVLLENVSSYKILVLTPFGTKSHKHVFEPLIKELGRRGHQLTVVANVKSSNLGENVREFVPTNHNDFMGKFPDPFEQRKKGFLSSFWDFNFIFEACHRLYQNQEFRQIMSNQTFDLIIMNGFLNHCLAGFLYTLRPTPFVYLVSMAAPNTILQRVGNWQPPSFVPNSFLPLSDDMTFFQRTVNTVLDWTFLVAGHFKYVPIYESIYREYLGQDVPGLPEIESNVSLVLMNSHFTTNTARPTLPDVVEVGGMHCGQDDGAKQKLSKDLEDFLSGAEHGFIYFSMGSVIKSKDFPESARKAFVNVFGRLKQRVLWKFDTDMDDLPKNVKIASWLPQQAILNHTNIKIFISHGGLLSTQESIYYGVPILGLPVGLDQDLNMNQMVHRKIGLSLEILEMTEEQLEVAIHRLLEEKEFAQASKYLSRAFRDQQQTPVQRAAYWCEYVIRFNGAPHLRSSARNLSFFVYHSWDVVAFLFSIIAVTVFVSYVVVRKLFSVMTLKIQKIFGQNQSNVSSRSRSSGNNNSIRRKNKKKAL